jgi:hypothetical protein
MIDEDGHDDNDTGNGVVLEEDLTESEKMNR